MHILINGKEHFINQCHNLDTIITRMEPQFRGLAVVLNNKVVPRPEWAFTRLHDRDSILLISES